MGPFQQQIELNKRRQTTVTLMSLAFGGLVIAAACLAIFVISEERRPLFLVVAFMGLLGFGIGVAKVLRRLRGGIG